MLEIIGNIFLIVLAISGILVIASASILLIVMLIKAIKEVWEE